MFDGPSYAGGSIAAGVKDLILTICKLSEVDTQIQSVVALKLGGLPRSYFQSPPTMDLDQS